MRVIEFEKYLDAENTLRVRFEMDPGEVLKFAVQLECRFREGWVPVVRYDTAHGFAHCDRLHPYGEAAKKEMATKDYNEALTPTMTDLMRSWRVYRRRYEMARPGMKPTEGVVERNIGLTGAVMRYLMEHPNVIDALPDEFELVILPDDDPEIRLHNLDLLDARASSGKPVVFARLKSHEEKAGFPTMPSLFVPVAV